MNVIMLLDNSLVSDARVEKEAMSLVENGYSVKIMAVRHPQMGMVEIKKFGTIYRVIPDSIDQPFSKNYKKFRKSFIKDILAETFEIIHCHDYKMLLLGAEIKKARPGITLIYDAHEYLPGWPFYKEIKG